MLLLITLLFNFKQRMSTGVFRTWYRQLSGGNYFLSVRQVFENEKKIKVLSILKYAGCSVKEMQEIASSTQKDAETSVGLLDIIKDIEASLSETDSALDHADCQVVCYMSGALARSEYGFRKCSSCRSLLTLDDAEDRKLPVLSAEGPITEDVREFMKDINRGGLVIPSDAAFTVGIKSWTVITLFKDNESLMQRFMEDKIGVNKKSLFASIVKQLLETDASDYGTGLSGLVCQKGHDFGFGLAQRFFSSMAKNFVKSKSDMNQWEREQKKIAKLQSSKRKLVRC